MEKLKMATYLGKSQRWSETEVNLKNICIVIIV